MRGPGTQQQQQQGKYKRSISMQEKPSQMPPALQKLLQSGIPQMNIDHPLTKGEVVTVGSLEDVHAKTSKDSKARKDVNEQSQKEGQFRTVESIENVHRTAGGTASTQEQSVPIKNLLAQLQKQQPSSISNVDANKGTIPHAASDTTLTGLLSLSTDSQPKPPITESNPDLNQTLLANLSTPTKSSGLLLPHHLTQGSSPASSVGGGSPRLKHVSSQPVLGAEGGGHQVPSLQQIAADGVPPVTSSNVFLQGLSTPESAESALVSYKLEIYMSHLWIVLSITYSLQ